MMRACPSRRATVPAHSAPVRPPTAEADSISPSTPGGRPSSRVRNTVCTATSIAEKKFATPVVSAIMRSTGCRSTKASPSLTCADSDTPGVTSGSGSRTRMPRRNSADARYPAALASTATGGPSSWTMPPPSPGPATCAAERAVSSAPLPATSRGPGSTLGR